jgi:hypothetical protein
MAGVLITACSSFSDSEIILKTEPDRKKPKYDYMPPPEKPVENREMPKKHIPISPQLGVRIPLGK